MNESRLILAWTWTLIILEYGHVDIIAFISY